MKKLPLYLAIVVAILFVALGFIDPGSIGGRETALAFGVIGVLLIVWWVVRRRQHG